MLMRYLVSQFIRSGAGRKILQDVSKAALGRREDGGRKAETLGPLPSPAEDRHCDIAFVFALAVESGGLVDLMSDTVTTRCASFLEHAGTLDGRHVVVLDSGEGQAHAAQATDDLVAMQKPSFIVAAGFACSLRDDLKRGHILMADRVTNREGKEVPIRMSLDRQEIESTHGLHVGRLLTVDEVIRSPDEKRALAERHDAVACDMESIAIAEIAHKHSVPFMCIRVITDTVDDRFSPELMTMFEQKSLASKVGAAAGAILNRPGTIKEMWQLKEDALKASDRLARFLSGIAAQR